MQILAAGGLRPHRTEHIGALLCDAILQSGINYRTVVAPRVRRVAKLFSYASCLPEFSDVVLRYGAHFVLMWNHKEKPRRLTVVVELLKSESVRTVAELACWLQDQRNRSRVLELRGFGEKTVDYMGMLAGLDAVAVDRHIQAFLGLAGIAGKDYVDARRIVCFSADLLGVSRASLDRAIWETCSRRKRVFHSK